MMAVTRIDTGMAVSEIAVVRRSLGSARHALVLGKHDPGHGVGEETESRSEDGENEREPHPGDVDVAWSVTDDYGGTGALQRTLTLSTTVGARGAAVMPVTGAPAAPGLQALSSDCGTCTGARGSLAVGDIHSCLVKYFGK